MSNKINGLRITKTTNFGIQRKIVANMTTESWQEIPHAVYTYRPDVTNFINEYSTLNSDGKHQNKITINTLMLKAIVEGIKSAPNINGHIDYKRRLVRGEIKVFEDINISMPWLLPTGEMMTINLKNFENKTLDEMTEYIENVSQKIKKTNLNEVMFAVSKENTLKALKSGRIITTLLRLIGSKTGKHKVENLSGREKSDYYNIPENKRLTKSDIEQGTITITNVGSIYKEQRGELNLLEIIPPQLVAIGISAAQEQPGIVVDKDGKKQIEVRKIMPVAIAFDHRALDFGDVIPFIKTLDSIFENPQVIHSW
ncbi:MAG: 2-oxo acid dehydrogenase subunit E2 [Oscillospiraceae bacterium]